jgi:hypothetical protein
MTGVRDQIEEINVVFVYVLHKFDRNVTTVAIKEE